MKNKNTNKPKILLRFISIVIVLIMLGVSGAAQLVVSAASTDKKPTVAVTSVRYTSSGATVTMTLSNAESGVDYTVYYRTSNGSAIAGRQFTQLQGSVKMNSGKTTANATVTFISSGQDTFGIDSFKAHNGTTYSGTKHLVFEVYYVESTGNKIYDSSAVNTDGTVVIDSSKANIKVNTYAPKTKIPVSYSANSAYLSGSMWTYKGRMRWSLDDSSTYEGGKNIGETNFTYNVSGMQTASGASSSSDVIFGYYAIEDDYSAYYSGKATSYVSGSFVASLSNSLSGSGDTSASMYNARFSSSNTVVTNGLRARSTASFSALKGAQSGADLIGTLLAGGTGYRSSLNGKPAVMIESGVAFMYFFKEYSSATSTVAVTTTTMAYTYYDNTAPEITGYYVQNGTYGAGQTVRLAVTFNELVRVRNYSSAPYLTVTASGSTGRLTFRYAGGDGTDTLYFEAVVPSGGSSSNINITNLKDCTVTKSYFENVVDMAYNYNGYSGADVKSNNSSRMNSNYSMSSYGRSTTLTVDNRAAGISLDSVTEIDANGNKSNYSYNATPASSLYGVEVNLRLSNAPSNAKVYYAWMNGYKATPYVSRTDYQEASAKESVVTIGANAMPTGEYTLCVLYISPAFVRTTVSYNFYFDSSPPEVTLTGGAGYNRFTTETHSFEIAAKDDSLTRIAKVEYALSTSVGETEATLDADGRFITIERLASTSLNETVTVGKIRGSITVGIDPKSAGKYYVYVRLTDGNGVKVVKRSDFSLAFDFRSSEDIAREFKCTLSGDGNSVNDTMFGGELTAQFGNVFFDSANFQWGCDGMTVWTVVLKHNGATLFTETLAESKDVEKRADYLKMAEDNYCVMFKENGFYELAISFTRDGETFEYHQDVYIYGVDGVYGGDNLNTLLGEYRYLKTKYWQLLRSYYTRRGDDNTVKNIAFTTGSEAVLPVFPDYQSAYDYVRILEEADIAKRVLTQADVNTIKSGGQLVADDVEPIVGETWYYYKSTSGTDTNSYRWYYYGLDDAASNLSLSLHKNILRIVGSQTDPDYPNDYRYATYDKALNCDIGNIFLSLEKTLQNPQMYDNTVMFGTDTTILASNYTVNNASGVRLFARPQHSTGTYNEVTGVIGAMLVTGVYEIVEIGPRGAIKFLVYIDNTAPYVDLEITNGSDITISYQDITGSGAATIYGKELFISALKGEGDPWAVLTIVKTNGETVSMTVDEFDANGGYTISESGTYTVYAFDRSGNVTRFTVMLKKDAIALTAPTKADATSYVFSITNRARSELATFAILYNGVVQTVDINGNSLTQLKQLSFTFGYSGTYNVEATDRYGYVLSEEFVLEKPLPTFTLSVLMEETGQYKNCLDLPGFMQVSEDGTTYTVFTSSPLRITYNDKNYKITWLVEPEAGTYSYAGFIGSSYRYNLTGDAKNWICEIGYSGDPYSSVTIISLADDTPPYVSAVATKGETTTSITDNSKTAADRITVSWDDDDSPLTAATYTYNGVTYAVDDVSLQAGSISLPVTNAEGVYLFTVTNIVGLSQTITFTVDNTIDLTVVSTDKEVNPRDGAVVYDNEDMMLVLKEAVTLYISSNLYPLISGEPLQIYVSYTESGTIEVMFLAGELEDATPIVFDAAFLSALRKGTVASATEGTALYDNIVLLREHFITVGKTAEGELYIGLIYTDHEGEELIYPIQINEQGLQASIELRLSKRASDIVVTDEKNDAKTFNPNGVLAVNYNVSLLGQKQTLDIITKITYAASGQSGEVSIYNGEGSLFTDTFFAEDGEHVITITNRYGNVTVRSIKIYRKILLDVVVNYVDGTNVKVDNSELVSNGSVTLSGSADTEYSVQAENAQASFVFTPDAAGENYVLTISQLGEHRFTVTDSFGNSLSYIVTIVAPQEKKTDDKNALLSGWKVEALRADEDYTCDKLSFVEGMNTAYVVYTYYAGLSLDDLAVLNDTTGKTVIVRNFLDLNKIDRYADLKIGDDGDGLYAVSFYDGSGNRISVNGKDTVIVSYKGTPQFTLTRVVEEGEEEYYDIGKALESGFWSNSSLFFRITAKEYSFTVNGASVTVDETTGKYAIVRGNEETEAAYQITYVDDYGNAYTFTANIYKKAPPIYYADQSIVITLDSVAYVKGSPAFTSDAIGIQAFYVKGTGTAVSYTPGENITGDGSYILTFTDIAGNQNAVHFTIDTKVDWRITVGKIGTETELFNGVASNKVIKLSRSSSETFSVVAATRNGKDVLAQYQSAKNSYTFEEDGFYELTLADRVGNTAIVTFAVVTTPRQSFIYETPDDWFVSALSYLSGGVNVYVNDTEFLSEDNGKVTLNGDRIWTVNMTNRNTGEFYTFEVTADNTAPTATFTGLAEHVKGTVTLTDVDSNGTAEIYLNGKRVSYADTEAGKKLSLSVSEPGDYRVVITDLAGNVTEYYFTVDYFLNAFSIAMIVIGALFVLTLIFVLFRMRRTMRVR